MKKMKKMYKSMKMKPPTLSARQKKVQVWNGTRIKTQWGAKGVKKRDLTLNTKVGFVVFVGHRDEGELRRTIRCCFRSALATYLSTMTVWCYLPRN